MDNGRVGAAQPAAKRSGPMLNFDRVFKRPRRRRPRGILSRAALLPIVLVIASGFLISSCVSIRIRMGQRPDVEVLEKSLRMGESRSTDVMSLLGEPFGKGRIMLPMDSEPRTMWTYYYAEGDLEDGRAIYLFVHFDEDRYDGYMWFASLPVMGGGAN
jgi:hypothetical protein